MLVTQTTLTDWMVRRYDFYSSPASIPEPLQLYRTRQQDWRQYSHPGIIAATDENDSDLKRERMGTSFVVVQHAGEEIFL